ncbi:hypothetical protein SY27_17345 [Flavobacterium sp. 316]|uniref:hypothetical protein n=1 Tax=Flavobacterium sp. 316 TaxID=1603293 RepID=UPI0005DDF344|nr:hypothetical protein [Flavobacterium sp. 316]KIX19815.1 hypothetical protein SY27_17345 [Flavobacterium sp. 316]
MEYFLELKFEDSNYNALIHFATTFLTNSEAEGKLFVEELLSAFQRRKVMILSYSYNRIDNNPELRERMYEYHDFYLNRATASIQVEQFHVENPNQEKSLWDNLIGKFFEGEDSTANIGNKYEIPVRVVDKKTRNPINSEFYYFSVEQLIPKG